MIVKAKFIVDRITKIRRIPDARHVVLTAMYDDGIETNARFAKATPSGEIQMQIDNPAAADFFTLGKTVYVDFYQAD